MEWQSFGDQFVAIVDNSESTDVINFFYFQSRQVDEAKFVIQGLSLTKDHCATACDLLKQCFGNNDRIIFAHIQDLLNFTEYQNDEL